ncbi:hypothetical protein ACGRHY_12475 [Streptomyces sp. HK10]|uniref:hypothetical protein n=1 Tax=Streptomyces sp. HK10 TaxID=3373255 RepID=UPI003749A8BB
MTSSTDRTAAASVPPQHRAQLAEPDRAGGPDRAAEPDRAGGRVRIDGAGQVVEGDQVAGGVGDPVEGVARAQHPYAVGRRDDLP